MDGCIPYFLFFVPDSINCRLLDDVFPAVNVLWANQVPKAVLML